MRLKEQMELESRYVMGTYARKPVEFVSGKGMWVKDTAGKEYLDFLSGIGTTSLGHCHPALTKALSEQAEKLVHVSNFYYIENRGEVAHMLSGLLAAGADGSDAEPWKVFFANSGAEANECAIKLARLKSKLSGQGAQNIVTLEKSFHGRTLATLAATAQPSKQEAFEPLPAGFIYTPLNDIAALQDLFAREGGTICAVMLECVQGESGVRPCTPEFLQEAERLAHAHGALLICDEVQCGMFRCGTRPFAFQRYGIRPDIVTVAKGVASGFPTGMCAARASVADTFRPGDHGSTFGGSCLAVAAAKATLETMQEPGFADRIERVGAYLRERIAVLPRVSVVRGFGLMCACDLDEAVSAADVVNAALSAGLIINNTGPHTLRFLPPLVCVEADVDRMAEILGGVLSLS